MGAGRATGVAVGAPAVDCYLDVRVRVRWFGSLRSLLQNNDDDFIDGCGSYQYYFILTVTLKSVVKKKAKEAGGFRVIASPTRADNRMDGVAETKDDGF